MSEALIGVLVGGFLASIVPVITLFTDSRRWRHEKKLEYLTSERKRLETLFSKTLANLSEAMAKNSYPSQMTSDILVLMPKSIGDRFETWMKENPKDDVKAKFAYMDFCLEMKKVLADLDAKISILIHE